MRTFWGDRMLLGVFDIDPDGDVPMHTHPHAQAGYVIKGALDVTIGDETRRMGPGDVYVIPGGVPHGVRAGREGARVVDVFSPVREEYQY